MKLLLLLLLASVLSSCGTTGDIYLPPETIKKNATPEQPTAPSASFSAMPGGSV